MIQYALIKRSPQFLRWYRTRIMLDWHRLRAYLPTRGRLLDVGCGVGSLDYEIARGHPALDVLGIDIDWTSIALAQRYNSAPNMRYEHKMLQSVEGQFDCILFIDVFHHVPPEEQSALVQACAGLLAPGGYVLIKDIERRGGQVSWLMDRYISGCAKVYLYNSDEVVSMVSRYLRVIDSQVCFRFPFPHYYIKATCPSGG